MKQIFLLRHGSTGVTGRYIGKTDIELSATGRKQIQSLKPKLSSYNFDCIFCSPLKRCVQTSEVLQLNSHIQKDKRLQEVDFGKWEGMNFDHIATHYPNETTEWCNADASFTFPSGERIVDFHNRIFDFCNDIKQMPHNSFLIISHGGVIRHIICVLLHLPLKNYLYFDVKYGHLATIDLYSEGGVLTSLNQG